MLCYNDKTYCDFYKTCKHGSTCPDALPDEVAEKAGKAGIGISQLLHKPECYEEAHDDR